SDSTRVAALLSGEMDLIDPVPTQDLQRVGKNDGTRAMTGPELRTIFLGMNQSDDELASSNVQGKNPFKDKLVRKAFYQAINIEAIHRAVMRGYSQPSAAMVAPEINGAPKDLERYPYDPEAAKAMLAEAGYPEGFELTMDCPNDRYVNDEAICQAVVSMLAKVGVKVNLLAQTKSKYFAKVLATGGYDTDFYLLGWTPGSIDSWNALYNLVDTRAPDGAGAFNLGGYSNPKIDQLTSQILTETDTGKRDGMIQEAWQILHDDVGYIPLHQQSLAWGVSDKLEVVQRPDNQILWRFMAKKGG
ncbi:MAG: ABC transporter substrate-binding protein, partial [Geminicoccaceae bacterium]